MDQACMKCCEEVCETESGRRAMKIAGIGWSLIFIWIGIVLVGDFHVAFGMIGVGTILSGIQAFRYNYGLDLELFWLGAGILLILAGLWLLEMDGILALARQPL